MTAPHDGRRAGRGDRTGAGSGVSRRPADVPAVLGFAAGPA